MKKLFSILAVFLLLLSCLTACGESADASPSTNNSTGGTNGSSTPSTPSTPSTSVPETEANLLVIDYFSCVERYGVNGQVDGSGSFYYGADISKLDYDKTNSDLTEFLKSIKSSIDCESGKLHNGDVVTVTLSYSHSEAEALGVTLKETSKTYTVSGLVEVLRAPTQDAYDQLYPELADAVANSYAETTNPTIATTYWLYAYDNCGDPYIVALAALFTYTSGGYTEYDICMVHMRVDGHNLMDRILAKYEFQLMYECQSGITYEEVNELVKNVFDIDGVCFVEEINN